MTSEKKCIVAMMLMIASLVIIVYLLIVYNKYGTLNTTTEPPPLMKYMERSDEMRLEYHNQDARFVFVYNSTDKPHYTHKCVALKCQNACDVHYHVKDAIAPLSMCLYEYNYCQCLRYTEFLNLNCETYNCNVNCVGSGHDYGVCNYNNNGCYCFDTLNFREGLSKTRWEKIIEYQIIKTEMKVLLVNLNE